MESSPKEEEVLSGPEDYRYLYFLQLFTSNSVFDHLFFRKEGSSSFGCCCLHCLLQYRRFVLSSVKSMSYVRFKESVFAMYSVHHRFEKYILDIKVICF